MTMSSVLLVGDFRSPHARAWGDFFASFVPHVTLLSSAPVGAAVSAHPPDPFSVLLSKNTRRLRGMGSDTVKGGRLHSSAVQARHLLGYLRARTLSQEIERICHDSGADWIHALRLPWEGVAVNLADVSLPWSLSLWGSDLITQAPQSSLLSKLSRDALGAVRGLTADCRRDVVLASEQGLQGGTPTLVVPGNLGLPEGEIRISQRSGRRMTAVCPRGILPHIRWRELIAAAGLLRQAGHDLDLVILDVDQPPRGHFPGVIFMKRLPRQEMLALASKADVVVSVSTSDGIPNSVLEFMSQGAIPVLSDLASHRELITIGVNGFLCDARNPHSIARAIAAAAEPSAREQMSVRNAALLSSRYTQPVVQRELVGFFESLQ